MKRFLAFILVFPFFQCFSSLCVGQITQSELESALTNALSSQSRLDRSDLEAVFRNHREAQGMQRGMNEGPRRYRQAGIRRMEIASGLRMIYPYTEYIVRLFSDVVPADRNRIPNGIQVGSEAEALKTMESAINNSFSVRPSLKLFGPVQFNKSQTYLWTGITVYQLPGGVPQNFLWVGYFDNGQWYHIVALHGERILKHAPDDCKEIMIFLIEQNFEEIADKWEQQFNIEKNRPWNYRSGVAVQGKAVGYQNGELEILEQIFRK